MNKRIEINTLNDLLDNVNKLIVPSYQRAYAWKKEQLDQFVSDMLEIKQAGGYYYGHFILETTKEGEFEIIDGQQRITTFILFLMVCGFIKKDFNEFNNYIKKFETVTYDQENFKAIQEIIKNPEKKWSLDQDIKPEEKTLSIDRILFGLNHFKGLFDEKKLAASEIDHYVNTLTDAQISTHITCSKAVAVQIFELQNTRGIKLNIIEKVKSKLMKAVYLKSEASDDIINKLQADFAEIYQLEESASAASFRGDMQLEDILLHHLRVVNDGSKASSSDFLVFHSPSKSGNKEEAILGYLDKQIADKEVVSYATNLVSTFKSSVEFMSKTLPEMDVKCRLIGDVLILDRALSTEFFILVHHKKAWDADNLNDEVIRLWERLLFTRDFHGNHYKLRYKDNFETLFCEIASNGDVEAILQKYVQNGFRPEAMDEGSLETTVRNNIEKGRESILNNAFNWWQPKMVYLLYKYERSLLNNTEDTILADLRKVIKQGKSIEHILPQTWDLKWIGENDRSNISEEGKTRQQEIMSIINGIGNLLLITPSENSYQSNKHPKDKTYGINGGSYSDHNNNRSKWADSKQWDKIISARGEAIYKVLLELIE